ncbi:hypothetical protein PF002_g17668 [Phytophthora fragariae]|uniref:CCHC-type domain-containing protein n=1 Tax=Phytophthora fragariae TaxID=53985 RepID=A0A6A3Y973_9STRA|nr:hypothetical protein PF004_g15249 [Phytophthora fragariae]KAE9214464.1 hypothetical protein PF002_g17668 [Phytophthora fragariae]
MTRRLHEFKMEDGVTMVKHLDNFDELIVGLQTENRWTRLSSKDFTSIEVKEKLLKEYEHRDKKEGTERALKVTANGSKIKGAKTFKGGKDSKGYSARKHGGFKSKCFNCGHMGHMKRDYPDPNAGNDNDAVFAVGKSR